MSSTDKPAAAAKPGERARSGVITKPRVTVPLLEDQDSIAGSVIDQTETVVINGHVTRIQRGESVEVSPAVFQVLRGKYPNI